jgi:glutamate-1-semialdehyde 2,1-aminomutase/spore coat polysaccharide biosynthesis protein SpsF
MHTVAIIQARMGSTRLPGKVLAELGDRPVLAWVVRAAAAIAGVDRVIVATSVRSDDDRVASWCADADVACFRGSEDDVLDRFLQAARSFRADVVLRITGDCPLLDPQVCGEIVRLLGGSRADYASNVCPPTWPDGLDCEAMTRRALEAAAEAACLPAHREHVTLYLRNNRHRFRVRNLRCPFPDLAGHRWTLDTPEDLQFLRAVVGRAGPERPPSYLEVLRVLDQNPELVGTNGPGKVNEERRRSRTAAAMPRITDFAETGKLLERAEKVIPLASQTFSKSRIQYPANLAPLFLTHGHGGRVWDVDGNEYVDLVCGLLPVVLGYCDPDVDAAIRAQLDNGISFSLATELEAELAERLIEIIPCAEMVRFGKNGSDATSAAVRLARAATGRDRIIACGYHGWQDWYIGATTRNRGVPGAVRAHTHMVAYGNLEAVRAVLDAHPGEVAAMVIEPMNIEDPPRHYLAELKELLHRAGVLLVFDEVITGFRYALGGAQSLFAVTPDLAAFGKAMGNGMPISAVVGRSDVMRLMEDIFYSGTFGGEALSLAAAIAVIDKMRREPVIETLWNRGGDLAGRVRTRIAGAGLGEVIHLRGKAPWMILDIRDHPAARKQAIRTRLATELIANGVLITGSHNLCYAHTAADMDRVVQAYERALARTAEELATGKLEARLPCPAIEPVFAPRSAPALAAEPTSAAPVNAGAAPRP